MRLRHRPSRHESRRASHGSPARSPRSSGSTARPSSRGSRLATQRPSLLLWRHRHLVVAVCLGTAVLVALSVLRPGPAQGRQVLVAAQPVSAGALITEQDVTTSSLPPSALPRSGLASKEQVVGTRAAIALEPGTVLTTSMTSGNMAQQLGPDERLVQVPVDVGAELARPGARVDVIGQAQDGASDRWKHPRKPARKTVQPLMSRLIPRLRLYLHRHRHHRTRSHQEFRSLLKAFPKECLSDHSDNAVRCSAPERESS